MEVSGHRTHGDCTITACSIHQRPQRSLNAREALTPAMTLHAASLHRMGTLLFEATSGQHPVECAREAVRATLLP